MTAQELLDAALKAQGLPSDYALAARLGITRAALSSYRTGRSRPDDGIARRLAELARLDPDAVMAAMAAERASTPELRAAWASIAARLQQAGAAVLAVILSVVLFGSQDAQARASVDVFAPGGSVSAGCQKYTLARFWVVVAPLWWVPPLWGMLRLLAAPKGAACST